MDTGLSTPSLRIAEIHLGSTPIAMPQWGYVLIFVWLCAESDHQADLLIRYLLCNLAVTTLEQLTPILNDGR